MESTTNLDVSKTLLANEPIPTSQDVIGNVHVENDNAVVATTATTATTNDELDDAASDRSMASARSTMSPHVTDQTQPSSTQPYSSHINTTSQPLSPAPVTTVIAPVATVASVAVSPAAAATTTTTTTTTTIVSATVAADLVPEVAIENMDIRKRVWEGRIPVCISLAKGELQALSAKEGAQDIKLYTFFSRVTYLPLVTSQVRSFFSRQAEIVFSESDAEIWYEFNSTPLKWHLPIGLLFDILCETGDCATDKDPRLPWELTVHFTAYPSTRLIRLSPSAFHDAPHDYFMSLLKQADYLRNGNIRTLMGLSKQEQNTLWESVWSANYDKFWSVNSTLINNGDTPFVNLPLRLYLSSYKCIVEPVTPRYPNGSELSTVSETGETSDEMSIIDTIKAILQARERDQDVVSFLDGHNIDSCKLILHGVLIHHDTPSVWLSKHFAYPDNFLHIVVKF